MIQTGKYFEGIVEMLNNFRTEVGTFSALGLLNINKHSENFMKRLLNLTYGFELENLNKEKSNYPGLDLGDTGDGIAYQITATKKSDKIDDTLSACLKYKHYETFKTINVFVLTTKQTTYNALKIITQPHFTFLPEENIFDFSDLLKEIEHLDPSRIKALHDYIKSELQPTIEAIRNDKSDENKQLLDIPSALTKSGLTSFFHWRSQVSIKNINISVPEINSKLNELISTPALKNQLLPILNIAFRETSSTKEIIYRNAISGTGVSNILYGQAMLIEKSSITVERAVYSNDIILANLLPEMLSLLAEILFFSKHMQNNIEIEVSISMEANTTVHFHPVNSLVLDSVFNSYVLESPFEFKETLTDINTLTLVSLLQKIIHGFVSSQSNPLSNDPFLVIKTDMTEFAINNIKTHLGIAIK